MGSLEQALQKMPTDPEFLELKRKAWRSGQSLSLTPEQRKKLSEFDDIISPPHDPVVSEFDKNQAATLRNPTNIRQPEEK